MGRAPCCDKATVRKGPWSPEEDAILRSYVEQHGTVGNWIALPQTIGLKRCGKSCRLRWLNYLRPNIKHGGFSEEEENIICRLYITIGSRWSIIAAQLPGRTDNDVKNYWNTRLKKKLLGKQRKGKHTGRRNSGSRGSQNKKMKEKEYYMVTNGGTENLYCPQLPVFPTIQQQSSGQESSFNDHDSIKKLLIKLGGILSDRDGNHQTTNGVMNYQFPNDNNTSAIQPQYYQSSSIDMFYASPHMNNAMNNSTSPSLLPEQSSNTYLAEFDQEATFNNQKNTSDWINQYLYGGVVSNQTETINGDQSIDMCEMSSQLICNPFVSINYEELQQNTLLQECALNGLGYPDRSQQ